MGDEWIPNFETVEYYVKGEFVDKFWTDPFRYVYSNGPQWTDSLALMIWEGEFNMESNSIMVTVPVFYEGATAYCPALAYQFDWKVGMKQYSQSIYGASCDCIPPTGIHKFGSIEEIKEGLFGGVRPLKYTDFNGERIIQGIGLTEWNDGECLFGPAESFVFIDNSKLGEHIVRNYRSMLVHFERDSEVLYDVWPEKTNGIEAVTHSLNPVTQNKSYDLTGRQMSPSTQKGLSIRNGRKVVR